VSIDYRAPPPRKTEERLPTSTSNGSGGKRNRISWSSDAPEIPRERFREAVNWMVGTHVFLWAACLGLTNDARLRGWMTGPAVPKEWKKYLRLLGVDPEMLKLPELAWQEYLRSLPEGQPPKRVAARSPLLHRTADVIAAIDSTEGGSTVLVAAPDFQDQKLVASIKAALERGVPFRFFITEQCRLKNQLLRLGANPAVSDGSVQVVTITSDHPIFAWAEAMILVTKPHVRVAEDSIAHIEVDDISYGFEQLYRPGDLIPPDDLAATNGRPLWTSMPPRKIDLALAMLRGMSETAEWLSGPPPPA
jgi:hypothetical protein